MYKHLLIATDGSEWASKALTQGLGLAKSLDAKATVVMATAPWNDVVSGEVAIALPMWRACAGSVLFAACVALTGVLPGAAQSIGDADRGLAYAQKTCAECHAVTPSQTASPRPGVATFKAIADTPGMTSTAIRVWLQTPHPTMPNLIINAGDRDDVIAYITSLK